MDEHQARDQLIAMLELIARGPNDALGLPSQTTPAEVRAAFHQLSKTFHPARFARMPTEIQKLSTEVFLALRGAHDTLAKSSKTPATRQSGPIPIVAAPQTTQQRSAQTGAMPPMQRQGSTGAMPPLQHPQGGAPAGRPSQQISIQPGPQQPRPATSPQRSPGAGPRTGEYPLVVPTRTKTADIPRVPSPSPPPATRPGTGQGQALQRPENVELAAAVEHLARGQWDEAREKLDALVAQAPESPKYRALLAYARGREAQLSQRLDEARIELMTALQIDPDLQLAKTALGELFARRK